MLGFPRRRPPALALPIAVGLALLLGFPSSPATAAGGVCTRAPELPAFRIGHTATPLPDGRVLVVGGAAPDPGGYLVRLASAALYDPARGAWARTGDMLSARTDHTASLLPDGRVLVAGGIDDRSRALDSTEMYDLSRGLWTGAGTMAAHRAGHTATVLADGRVLLVGGWDDRGAVAMAELYDPSPNAWERTGDLHEGRYEHTATLLPDGRVLVAGGIGTGLQGLGSAELFDPTTGSWSRAPYMAAQRADHTATLLLDGRVLVAGGFELNNPNGDGGTFVSLDSAEIFDPAGGKWSGTASLGAVRAGHTASRLADGRVLVTGGMDHVHARISNSVEIFDPADGRWAASGSLIAARERHSAALLENGQVLLIGGASGRSAGGGRAAEVYDAASGATHAVPGAPSPFSRPATVARKNAPCRP
jgi:hypothetical protein